jgi:hypothetical protein
MKKKTVKQPYVIARGTQSGVHAGYLVSRKGAEVTLREARRIWYWEGAATLSELAELGTSAPSKCKFPVTVAHIIKTDVCEVLTVTEHARLSIASVPEWSYAQ